MHVWPQNMGSSKHRLVPARKATKFMTNSRSLGKELKVKCDGSHEHQPLVDGRAKDAARYPPALCRAICRGLQKEKMQRCMQVRAVLEVGEGVHKRLLDTEESHDVEIEAGSPLGSVLGPWGWVGLEGYEDKPVKANGWPRRR